MAQRLFDVRLQPEQGTQADWISTLVQVAELNSRFNLLLTEHYYKTCRTRRPT